MTDAPVNASSVVASKACGRPGSALASGVAVSATATASPNTSPNADPLPSGETDVAVGCQSPETASGDTESDRSIGGYRLRLMASMNISSATVMVFELA